MIVCFSRKLDFYCFTGDVSSISLDVCFTSSTEITEINDCLKFFQGFLIQYICGWNDFEDHQRTWEAKSQNRFASSVFSFLSRFPRNFLAFYLRSRKPSFDGISRILTLRDCSVNVSWKCHTITWEWISQVEAQKEICNWFVIFWEAREVFTSHRDHPPWKSLFKREYLLFLRASSLFK